ncbi:MAG: MBL fold metallo-hydrolase, partial [Pseudomonadales bacterium]
MASLQLLGVGSADSVRHFNTNALIQQGQDRMLIDAGHTIGRALDACDLKVTDIDAVWITHCHADHIYGLERIGSQALFSGRAKPILYIDSRLINELWEHSLSGSMGRIGEGECTLDSYFDVRPVSQQFRHGAVEFELFETRHTPGKLCFGALINGWLMYSGDTLPLPEIVSQLNPELILHDFTMF